MSCFGSSVIGADGDGLASGSLESSTVFGGSLNGIFSSTFGGGGRSGVGGFGGAGGGVCGNGAGAGFGEVFIGTCCVSSVSGATTGFGAGVG